MNDEEFERLQRVADRYNLNAAGLIRMLVKVQDDMLQRETEKKP